MTQKPPPLHTAEKEALADPAHYKTIELRGVGDRIIERVHQRPDFYRWTKRPRPAYAGGEAAC